MTRGGAVAWIGRGPQDFATMSIHCHPSTSGRGYFRRLKSEVLATRVDYVGVNPFVISG